MKEHSHWVDAAGAGDLVQKTGYRHAYRTQAAFDTAVQKAARFAREYGVIGEIQNQSALLQAEPALYDNNEISKSQPLIGAVHWAQPWNVSNPGELVARYAALFLKNGGTIIQDDFLSLQQVNDSNLVPSTTTWTVKLATQTLSATHVVIATGPWADETVRPLGYTLPLFVKRGYHQHFTGGAALNSPMLDAERGYVLAPMAQGMRLTTGVEFAKLNAPQTPRQLVEATAAARQLMNLPTPVESTPWLGCRPCTSDMRPIIGAAPNHKGLWFNFGHAHQGFTLGPASGRLIAELMTGETPYINPTPYSAARFL